MKKIVVSMMALLLTVVLLGNQTAKAEAAGNVSGTYEDLIGYAKDTYYFGGDAINDTYDIIDLFVINDSIVLEYNACVDFVDVIGVLESGQYVNLTRLVEYSIENEEIASFELGKVKGIDQGTTQITVTYGGFSGSIFVNVLQFKPLVSLSEVASSLNTQTFSSNTALLRAIGSDSITRAEDMMNYVWYPSQKFIPNNQDMSYAANTKLKGIPYSQGNQTNLAQFQAALSKSNFYSGFYRDPEKTQRDPMYGLDCSGFLCASWNVKRCNTGDFVSELRDDSTPSTKFVKLGSYELLDATNTKLVDKFDLKTAYLSLIPSAGLVTRRNGAGHARFVVSVDGTNVNCIDTSNNFPSLERYSFNELADDGYLPFWTTQSYQNSGW